MPMISNIGQGRHRFGIGKGLYTASDGIKGKVPTPSQLARGIDPEGPDNRWWALTDSQRKAWGALAVRPMSGRKLYSTVNRLAWNDFFVPYTDPPGPPYVPLQFAVYNVSAVADYEGLGVGAYVWSFPGSIPNMTMEISLYKPATGIPGFGGTGAYWKIVGTSALDAVPQFDFGSLFVDILRGNPVATWVTPKPVLGDVLTLRFLPGTYTHFPGLPQYFTTIVS